MFHFLQRSFRNRLFTAMLAASLLPLLACTALMVHMTKVQMDSTTRAEVSEYSDILLKKLDSISTGFQSAAEKLEASYVVCNALKLRQMDFLEVNSQLFRATEDARSFADFELYNNDGFCQYSTMEMRVDEVLPTNWGILHAAAAEPGTLVYMAAESSTNQLQPLLQGAVQIRNFLGEPVGYLLMKINLSGFRTLLEGRYPQNDVLLLSRFFRPIYSTEPYLTTTLAPHLRQAMLSGAEMETDDFYYGVTMHEGTGLFLVLRHPRMFTASTLWMFYTTSLICALICIGFAIPFGLSLSRQISNPLLRLQQSFDQLVQNDLDIQVPMQRSDELGMLALRFNTMVQDLRTNREELLQNQQELKEAQIRMLQAQLNPHFLCNTLDTMKWISKINKVPQVALMSTNLADILRFCISVDEFVPLYREVEILERYIEIQKIRLRDDFTFALDISEELYDCLVPKMILQPIVENAILHGLDGVENSTITVRAFYTGGENFQITVTDNGKGFPPEMVGCPYHRDKNLAKGHLGLYNVDTILMRYYGENCGLYLDCGPEGVGALVTATLPIRYEEDAEC